MWRQVRKVTWHFLAQWCTRKKEDNESGNKGVHETLAPSPLFSSPRPPTKVFFFVLCRRGARPSRAKMILSPPAAPWLPASSSSSPPSSDCLFGLYTNTNTPVWTRMQAETALSKKAQIWTRNSVCTCVSLRVTFISSHFSLYLLSPKNNLCGSEDCPNAITLLLSQQERRRAKRLGHKEREHFKMVIILSMDYG